MSRTPVFIPEDFERHRLTIYTSAVLDLFSVIGMVAAVVFGVVAGAWQLGFWTLLMVIGAQGLASMLARKVREARS